MKQSVISVEITIFNNWWQPLEGISYHHPNCYMLLGRKLHLNIIIYLHLKLIAVVLLHKKYLMQLVKTFV